MEHRSNEPKYLDTETSPPSSPSNPKTIDSSRNTLSPISTLLNNENMFQTPFLAPQNPTPNPRSEPSNPTETTLISFVDPSPTRHQKEPHPLKNRKNKSSNPSPNPLHQNHSHNPNPQSPAPNTTEPNSASQTPSEHSSGSDAAFYCSVGSPSSDGEDASSDSWVPGTEIEMEVNKSRLAKVSLREAESTARTGGASASAVIEEEEEEEEDDDKGGEEERNEIHDRDSMRRKSKKGFTFLKRIFGRRKSRDGDGGVGGIG